MEDGVHENLEGMYSLVVVVNIPLLACYEMVLIFHVCNQKFYVVDDELKDWVWGTAHKKWRDFKSYLKEKYFKEEKTDEDLHVCRDDRVTIDDWQWLITFWRSEEFQKRSEQGKQNRSKMKVLHTAGSKSYACVASEMYKENGYAPRRDELFLRTHTKRKMDLLFIAILPK